MYTLMHMESIVVTFRADGKLVAELDKIAKNRQHTRSLVILEMLRDAIYLKQPQVEPKRRGMIKS